jgi:hypothetical protein
MLLMTGNTRSGGVSQGRPQGAAAAVGAQRRALTDAGAEGTRPPMLRTSGRPLFDSWQAYLPRTLASAWTPQ